MNASTVVEFVYNHIAPDLIKEKLAALMEEFYKAGYGEGYKKGREDANEFEIETYNDDKTKERINNMRDKDTF